MHGKDGRWLYNTEFEPQCMPLCKIRAKWPSENIYIYGFSNKRAVEWDVERSYSMIITKQN